jgi:septum formation protein
VLASASAGRRMALEQTAIPFTIHPSSIDERAIEEAITRSGGGADAVAAALARRKALVVSKEEAGRLVLGADQVMSCEGRLLAKPTDPDSARRQLEFLSGRTHRLHSAVCIVREEAVAFEAVQCADLKMRVLSEAFIETYLQRAGDAVLGSVGCYQLEALGVHLFESICGDYWTILGLPLLPVLAALRRQGALLA